MPRIFNRLNFKSLKLNSLILFFHQNEFRSETAVTTITTSTTTICKFIYFFLKILSFSLLPFFDTEIKYFSMESNLYEERSFSRSKHTYYDLEEQQQKSERFAWHDAGSKTECFWSESPKFIIQFSTAKLETMLSYALTSFQLGKSVIIQSHRISVASVLCRWCCLRFAPRAPCQLRIR